MFFAAAVTIAVVGIAMAIMVVAGHNRRKRRESRALDNALFRRVGKRDE
jgi:FtsZ-interacting cell division protein ZipA